MHCVTYVKRYFAMLFYKLKNKLNYSSYFDNLSIIIAYEDIPNGNRTFVLSDLCLGHVLTHA